MLTCTAPAIGHVTTLQHALTRSLSVRGPPPLGHPLNSCPPSHTHTPPPPPHPPPTPHPWHEHARFLSPLPSTLVCPQMQKRMQQVKESASSPISQADFLDALRKVNPSVGKSDLDRFAQWMEEFGSA